MTDYEVMMNIWNKGKGSIRVEKNPTGWIVFLNNEVQTQFDKGGNYISTNSIQEWKDKH